MRGSAGAFWAGYATGNASAHRRAYARWGCLLAVVLVISGSLTFCAGPPWYYSSKYGGIDTLPPARPAAVAGECIPECQTEGHTCGLHAVRSVYRAYGLDPDTRNLRFRLGADKPINQLAQSSRGTIHLDILRVLRQDGFDAEILWTGFDDGTAATRIRDHLENGQLVIALTKVGDTYHWVVLCGLVGDTAEQVLVCDSLFDEVYTEPLGSYVGEQVFSGVVVGGDGAHGSAATDL